MEPIEAGPRPSLEDLPPPPPPPPIPEEKA